MRTRRLWTRSTLLLTILLPPQQSAAQSSGTEAPRARAGVADSSARGLLPAVRIIGSEAGAISRIPGAVSVIDSARLRALNAVSIKDAVRAVPGMHVMDEDAFGLNLNIGIRGLAARRSQRVLLLEDGMPIHLGPYSDPTAHYHPPVDGLSRVEIVKGSAQIAFGPQTVGGVVNFVRSSPPDRPTARLAIAGGSRAFQTARLSAGGTWGGRGVVLDVARRRGDGTRRGQAHQVDDLSLRGVLPLGPSQRLALSAGIYREQSRYGEAGLSQTEFDADPFQNPLPNDVFDLSRRAGQAVHELSLGRGIMLRTQAYAQRVERTAWRQASSSADRLGNAAYERAFGCAAGATSVDQCKNTGRPRRYAFVGLEPRLSVSHALFGADATLETGLRAHDETMRRQERAGTSATARSGPLIRDNAIDTRAGALFIREQVRAGAWMLTPGVRVEHVRSVNENRLANTRNTDGYTEVLPGMGLSWERHSASGPSLTLLTGIHRGFAPPRPADILNPIAGEGLVQVDAEVSWTSELGARFSLGEVASLDVTAFRIDFDNQVVSGSLVGSGQRFVNAGRTLHQGVEIGTHMALDRLLGRVWPSAAGGLGGDIAWTYLPTARFSNARASTVDARQSVLGKRIPFAPRSALNVGLGWQLRRGASLRIDGDVVGSQYADDLNSVTPAAQGRRGLLPGYTVLNVALRAPVVGLASGPIVLTAAVKNVANRVYITDRQEGIQTGMPRLFTMGIELER